eukprot:8535180-Pyramimonas_sp.AAC.1
MGLEYAKLGARLQQHPEWHRAACIQRFKLVTDVLEFAAYVGVLGRGLVDTSEGSSPVERGSRPPNPPGPRPGG